MSKLNIFIDGSWLFKNCAATKVFAAKTEEPYKRFQLDFVKLNKTLLNYIRKIDGNCDDFGEKFLAISVFEIPSEVDDWPSEMPDITNEQIEKVRKSCFARESFIKEALKAGYSDSVVYRPNLKPYIIRKLHSNHYQEKHVDTSVVALLIRAAITRSRDYHVVITGDSDILPAIKVAYPEYTRNVFLATSHPDELNADHRQTSFSLSAFHFDILPIYFQDHINEIIHGEFIYNCGNCNKVLVRPRPIPSTSRPYCKNCHSKREA